MGTPQEPVSPTKVIDRLVDHQRTSERAAVLGALAMHDAIPQPDLLVDWGDVANWMLPMLGIPGVGNRKDPDPIVAELVLAGRNVISRMIRNDMANRTFIRDSSPIFEPLDESHIVRGKTRRTLIRPEYAGLFTLADLKALHDMGDLFPPRVASLVVDRNRPLVVKASIEQARDAIDAARDPEPDTNTPRDLGRLIGGRQDTETWEMVGHTASGAPILRDGAGTLWKAVGL